MTEVEKSRVEESRESNPSTARLLDPSTAFLNMNVRFRSNDAYKAAFMNIFALVQLQQKIANRV
jgi:hypothetical protein